MKQLNNEELARILGGVGGAALNTPPPSDNN